MSHSKGSKEHPTSVGWPIACVRQSTYTVFPYLECAAGADHSILLGTSHTVPANKLSL